MSDFKEYSILPEGVNFDKNVILAPNAAEACNGAHAIAVMTEWDEFATYDYQALYQSMAKPAFIFDGRNVLPHSKLREIGFRVYAIGKPRAPLESP